MPTPEEIKKIAREYAEYRAEPFDDAHDEIALEHFKEAIAFFRWLSKDYCIVPKDDNRTLQNQGDPSEQTFRIQLMQVKEKLANAAAQMQDLANNCGGRESITYFNACRQCYLECLQLINNTIK